MDERSKSLMAIVDKITGEKKTRGCLNTEIDDKMGSSWRTIYRDFLLIASFEKETNLRRKWVIACLIPHHKPAEIFFNHHRCFDEDDNEIFTENPES